MKPARQLLGAVGMLGLIAWGFWTWLASKLRGWGDGFVSSHASSEELFLTFGPLIAFVFYIVLTMCPCRSRSALLVGIAVQIPLLLVICYLFSMGHGGPPFGFALLLGPFAWLKYVRELRREETKE